MLLVYLNNESQFGENTTHVYDFSVDVNPDRAGLAHNNGSLRGGAAINKTNFRLGTGAVQLDGSDDRICFGNPASLNFGTGSFSISTWFKKDAASSGLTFSKHADDGYFQKAGGVLDCFIDDGVTSKNTVDFMTTTLVVGRWYHGVCVIDRATQTLYAYLDGVLDGQVNDISGVGSTDEAVQATIGSRSCGTTNLVNGKIDEVSVWNRTLSNETILKLYKRGVMRLNLSVRNCDDAACDGESFVARDINYSDETLLNFSTNNRYFQYQLNFSNNASLLSTTPLRINNVTIGYTLEADLPLTINLSDTIVARSAEVFTYGQVIYSNGTTVADHGISLYRNNTLINATNPFLTNITENATDFKSGTAINLTAMVNVFVVTAAYTTPDNMIKNRGK